MNNEYKHLLDVLETRAGEALRVVAEYNEDSEYVIYKRDDLEDGVVHRRLSHVAENARTRPKFIESLYRNADLELYEDYVLMHWAESETEGVVISFEPDVAQQLSGFVEECNHALEAQRD